MKKYFLVLGCFLFLFIFYQYYIQVDHLQMIPLLFYNTQYLQEIGIGKVNIILLISFVLLQVTILFFYLKDVIGQASYMNLIRYRMTKFQFLKGLILKNSKNTFLFVGFVLIILIAYSRIAQVSLELNTISIYLFRIAIFNSALSINYTFAIIDDKENRKLVSYYLFIIIAIFLDLALDTNIILFSNCLHTEELYFSINLFFIIIFLVIKWKERCNV